MCVWTGELELEEEVVSYLLAPAKLDIVILNKNFWF